MRSTNRPWNYWHRRIYSCMALLIAVVIGWVWMLTPWTPTEPPPLNCYAQIEAEAEAGQLTVVVGKGEEIAPCLFGGWRERYAAQDSCVAAKRRTLVLELQKTPEGTVRYWEPAKYLSGRSFDPAGLSGPMLEVRLAAEKDSLYCRWRRGREDDCRAAEVADSTRRALEAMGGRYQPCHRENCR